MILAIRLRQTSHAELVCDLSYGLQQTDIPCLQPIGELTIFERPVLNDPSTALITLQVC